jgi:post-segregation antitoxin (ccd killing protein)
MAEAPEEYRAITVTVTARQREWLYERMRSTGVPISRTIRDAISNTFPEADARAATTEEKVPA